MAKDTSREARDRRHERIRKRLDGTTERPRLNVFRSLQHIYAQVIDDEMGHTFGRGIYIGSRVAREVGRLEQIPGSRARGQIGG